jgi:CheY-like chemotaxis protein
MGMRRRCLERPAIVMKKILVVDDNLASLELAREVLQDSSHQVLEARDGREAMDLLATTEPDLVLLDIHMPALDGYSVLRRIRQDPRLAGLRVVALTASAMQGDREQALSAGFDDYIVKPLQIGALRNRVKWLLGP